MKYLFILIFVALNYSIISGQSKIQSNKRLEIATFGEGCFWCSEAIFQKLRGVVNVTAGYSGGNVPSPTYEQVCAENTGHAEVIQIKFDPAIISYDELLKVFFSTHDPTTLNRQGADVGEQYRSVIFYHNRAQKKAAYYYKRKIDEAGLFENPVVTEIVPFKEFYKAENYHQNYYNKNKSQPYCQFVITPKLEKFEKLFKTKIKK